MAAGVYVFTPGQSRFTAYFDEAGQIKVGDSVRVAGVPVGTVKKVSLVKDSVAVVMSVRRDVFIGDESRAESPRAKPQLDQKSSGQRGRRNPHQQRRAKRTAPIKN